MVNNLLADNRVTLVFGAVFESSAEPRLPGTMVVAGGLEVRARPHSNLQQLDSKFPGLTTVTLWSWFNHSSLMFLVHPSWFHHS